MNSNTIFIAIGIVIIVLIILIVILLIRSSKSNNPKEVIYFPQDSLAYKIEKNGLENIDLSDIPKNSNFFINTYFVRDKIDGWYDMLDEYLPEIDDNQDIVFKFYERTCNVIKSKLNNVNYDNTIINAARESTWLNPDIEFPLLFDGTTSIPASMFDQLIICFAVINNVFPNTQPMDSIMNSISLQYLNDLSSPMQTKGSKIFTSIPQAYTDFGNDIIISTDLQNPLTKLYNNSSNNPVTCFLTPLSFVDYNIIYRYNIPFGNYALEIMSVRVPHTGAVGVWNNLLGPTSIKCYFEANTNMRVGNLEWPVQFIYSEKNVYYRDGSSILYKPFQNIQEDDKYFNIIPLESNEDDKIRMIPIYGGKYDPQTMIWTSVVNGFGIICNISTGEFTAQPDMSLYDPHVEPTEQIRINFGDRISISKCINGYLSDTGEALITNLGEYNLKGYLSRESLDIIKSEIDTRNFLV